MWRQGDVTKINVDAVVNAANETLVGRGDIDGVIHEGAGSKLLDVCRKLSGCETGEYKISSGYKLLANYVLLWGIEITMTKNWITIIKFI